MNITLVNETIGAAVTAGIRGTVGGGVEHAKSLSLLAVFAYGAGGTTVKAWVQTSLDGGTTWIDIANFAFTTAAASKMCTLTNAAVTTIGTPADGTTADNTVVNGFLGDMFRVKLTTTGTYTGATSLVITGVLK